MASDIIHQWIYVIIPIAKYSGTSVPLFSAFCKGCRDYFTEELEFDTSGSPIQSKGNLPKYGCNPIDDIKF